VEAAMTLAQRERIIPERVTAITARVTPMVRETLRYDRPKDENQAMFSLPYAIACALVDHTITPGHLDPRSLARADLRRLMDRVSIETDAVTFDVETAPEAACVTVETTDGRRHEETRLFGVGDPRSPISEAAFERKVHRCLEAGLDHRQIGKILELSRRIETLGEIRRFTSLLKAV
jgi:2-methylcitrate dehydratase PrpD